MSFPYKWTDNNIYIYASGDSVGILHYELPLGTTRISVTAKAQVSGNPGKFRIIKRSNKPLLSAGSFASDTTWDPVTEIESSPFSNTAYTIQTVDIPYGNETTELDLYIFDQGAYGATHTAISIQDVSINYNPTYILAHDGFDKLTVSGFVSEPNIVKLMFAPIGSSTEFEYIGNMTYDAASSKAIFTINKLGIYKAAIDVGTSKVIETSPITPFASAGGGPVGFVQSPTITSGATPGNYNVSLTVSDISSSDVTVKLFEGHSVSASASAVASSSPTSSVGSSVTIVHSDVSLGTGKAYTVRLSPSSGTDTDYEITVAPSFAYIGFYGVPQPQATNYAVAFAELILSNTLYGLSRYCNVPDENNKS